MNPAWHDELEAARSVEEAVASVRRCLSSLPLHDLPRYCDPRRICADDDVDDLTFKLSQWQREATTAAASDVFGFVLHASLRISSLNRQRVKNMPMAGHVAAARGARQMQ